MKLKEIQIEKNEITNWKDYRKRPAREDDFKDLITEPCRLMSGENLVGIYLVIPKSKETELLREVVKRVDFMRNKRTGGLTTHSKVFGYLPREIIRKDYCSSSAMSVEKPSHHAVICNFAETLSKHYKETCPEMFDWHDKLIKDKIKKEWIIKGTPYTSGVINKNTQLNYHWDRGNFPKIYSNMVAFKKDCVGGHLAMPEYNVGLEVADLSICLFAGQKVLHGVTPFQIEKQGGYRYTLVYYSMQQMWKCEDVTTEIARIRTRKTTREKNRLLRQQGKLKLEDDPIKELRVMIGDPKKYMNYNLFAELGIDRKYLGVPFTRLPKDIQKKLVDYKQEKR
jgi:hypothetical protein